MEFLVGEAQRSSFSKLEFCYFLFIFIHLSLLHFVLTLAAKKRNRNLHTRRRFHEYSRQRHYEKKDIWSEGRWNGIASG